MNNLIIYGDSFSAPWNGIQNQNPLQREYVVDYKKKYNKEFTHFAEEIKNHFGLNKIYNHSVYGGSNYCIMDAVGKTIKKIDDSDYVIVGWTSIFRWRYVHESMKYWELETPSYITTKEAPFFMNNKKPGYHQVIFRDCKIVRDELIHYQNILKIALPKNTIFWTPFAIKGIDNWKGFFDDVEDRYETIDKCQEIKGKNDGHFSSKGHIELSHDLKYKFKNHYTNIL